MPATHLRRRPLTPRRARRLLARRGDPSGTRTIVRGFDAEMGRKFKAVADLIRTTVETNDAFGLSGGIILALQGPPVGPIKRFDFPSDAAKIDAFKDWLRQVMDDKILEVHGTGRWTDRWIRPAYGRGVEHADQMLRAAGLEPPRDLLEQTFNQPIHASKVELLYVRAYSELRGITEDMDRRITRILADGLSRGLNPREMARTIVKDGVGIGRRRATTIARTEVMRAHAESTLTRYGQAGLREVVGLAELQTAGDDLVCQRCINLEGNTYTLDEARGLIPVHPNCRCVWLPVTGPTDREILDRPSSYYTPQREASETLTRYRTPRGRLSPQRQELHDAIVRSYLQGQRAAPDGQQEVFVLGGGPASGKSSSMRGVNLDGFMKVDVDEVRAMFPEYQEAVAAGDTGASAIVHEEASFLSKRIIREGVNRRTNILVDGTGDNSYQKLEGKIAEYRKGGHRVVGRYVTVDTDEAVRRMTQRGDRTGRYVPEIYLRETHRSVSFVVEEAIERELFDELTLWDNNLPGEPPRLILEYRDGELTIVDEDLWEQFLRKKVEEVEIDD